MKLKLLYTDKKNNKLHLIVKGSNDSFINFIRRTILDEVPTLAVDEVEIRENSSVLYDEVIAHRLGLIPIKTDLSSYKLPVSQEEVDGRSARCTLTFTLKSSKKGLVTPADAKSEDPKCTFVYDDMPIVKLLSKQKIDMTILAVVGQGKNHSKWSPGFVYYKREPIIEAKNLDLDEEQKKRIEAGCGNAVKIQGSRAVVNTDELYISSRFDLCIELLKQAGATVTDSENHIVTVESWGQLSCKEMLEYGAEMVISQLEDFSKQLASLEGK